MRVQLQLEQRRLQRSEHGEIATAGTPIRMDAAAVSLLRELASFGGGGRCNGRGHTFVKSVVSSLFNVVTLLTFLTFIARPAPHGQEQKGGSCRPIALSLLRQCGAA